MAAKTAVGAARRKALADAREAGTDPKQAQDAAESQVWSEDADVLPPATPAAPPAAAVPTGKRKTVRQMAEELMAETSLERRIEPRRARGTGCREGAQAR